MFLLLYYPRVTRTIIWCFVIEPNMLVQVCNPSTQNAIPSYRITPRLFLCLPPCMSLFSHKHMQIKNGIGRFLKEKNYTILFHKPWKKIHFLWQRFSPLTILSIIQQKPSNVETRSPVRSLGEGEKTNHIPTAALLANKMTPSQRTETDKSCVILNDILPA